MEINANIAGESLTLVEMADGQIRSVVTDAVHATHLSRGRYSLVGREIELLSGGQVVTTDRRAMVGSTLSMNRNLACSRSLRKCPSQRLF